MDDTINIIAEKSETDLRERIEETCDVMEQHYAADFYSKIRVQRHWSKHNPEISEEIGTCGVSYSNWPGRARKSASAVRAAASS